MFEPYRPRRPTRKEEEQDEERQQYKRKRQGERKKQEREWRDQRTSKLSYSELSGVGYQDFNLGPSSQVRTRVDLDRRAHSESKRSRNRERPFLDAVPSLADCCLDLVAENYGDAACLAALDSVRHRSHVAPLFERVKRTRNDEHDLLPYEFWLDFALEFGLDLPDRYKTYRGLVVSTDQAELELVRDRNDEAHRRWIQHPSDIPSFFLSTLDLSNDRTFTDADMYKLRNPLSYFLAVLKLDGTLITDTGITWIARAANDSDAYKHLEVLSLKGLNRVTNDGVARLSKLSNLRMLDLRNTGCNHQVISRIHTRDVYPSWTTPRARKDLAQTLVEFQLFGGSYSPSRLLSILHRLARIHHEPVQSVEEVIRAPLMKMVSIHLSAMTRHPVTAASKPAGDKTSEELYNEQMALSTFAGSAMATHHSAFGTLTSTVSLAKKLVDEDGRAMGDKAAAFRNGLGDGVALGEWVGQGRVGGRSTLYNVGTRKVSSAPRDREPFSDSEDELEKETKLRDEEAEALRNWEDQTRGEVSFYAGRKPTPRPPRVIVAAEQSKLTLLRHIPFVPPHERKSVTPPSGIDEQAESVADLVRPINQTREGATLLKKKRKLSDESMSISSVRALSSSSPLSTPQRPPLATSASDRRSSRDASSTPTNPFTKKKVNPVSAGRTDRKNIVKCAPALTKRSNLSAFKR